MNAERPQVAWECLNGGVPGYNTAMEVETLRARLLDYDPDLVVVHFVGNDLSLPTFVRNRAPYFTLTNSFLWEFVQAARKGILYSPDSRLAHRTAPEEYRNMLGLAGYRRAMTELLRISRERNMPILAVSQLHFPKEIAEVLSELAIPTIDFYDGLEAHLRAQGLTMDDYLGSDLTRDARDAHPSAIGHRIASEVLFGYLERSHLLEQLVERQLGPER